MSEEPVLSIRHLRTSFGDGSHRIVAVDDVSFEIGRGEVFGIVGESGCGKSTTCRSIIRLFAGAKASMESGEILLEGRDLALLGEGELAQLRGAVVSMIFQDPMSSLNPTMTIGTQIAEVLRRHRALSRRQARSRAVELLGEVGVPNPASRINGYPHQFSGGMRQRVLIAIALACRPKLLIADEPTSALDVTIQDQILKLILRQRHDIGTSVLLVTHDLGVVAQTCDHVGVMYAGKIVELGSARQIFVKPAHPYTRALLAALPSIRGDRRPLVPIGGGPPDLAVPPPGCRFHPRCSMAIADCAAVVPEAVLVDEGHRSACIRIDRSPR
jgi:oligopeptide/dipeptide ABC transporter ATP-binding protein